MSRTEFFLSENLYPNLIGIQCTAEDQVAMLKPNGMHLEASHIVAPISFIIENHRFRSIDLL